MREAKFVSKMMDAWKSSNLSMAEMRRVIKNACNTVQEKRNDVKEIVFQENVDIMLNERYVDNERPRKEVLQEIRKEIFSEVFKNINE